MRIEEIEKFFKDQHRQQALRNSENLVKRDQLVCDIMSAWTKVTDLTKYSVQVQVTPDTRKALLIARTALELAVEEIQRPEIRIERISTDYVEYLRGRSDPRD